MARVFILQRRVCVFFLKRISSMNSRGTARRELLSYSHSKANKFKYLPSLYHHSRFSAHNSPSHKNELHAYVQIVVLCVDMGCDGNAHGQ